MKTGKSRPTFHDGFSLIEILIVILIFSVLAILATQSLALSLRGSRKSESLGEVRESVDFSISIMERFLRSAKSVTCSADNKVLDYTDENGYPGRFSCLSAGSPPTGYIASGSANIRLTSTDVNVDCTGAVFSCPTPTPPAPPSVLVSIKATSATSSGAESASQTVTSKILLRKY